MTEAFRAAVRHLPRFAAAAAAPADDGDDEDRGGESQPLLSPPACVVAMTYVCDWAQAIQCTYSSLKPMPCQREGCDALVHHLYQGVWERQEGYEDTVARLCCAHHPDYKYVGVPSKVSVAIANAQDVMLKAKVVNVESQVTILPMRIWRSYQRPMEVTIAAMILPGSIPCLVEGWGGD